jgi:ketosteroid isomerase-like protein
MNDQTDTEVHGVIQQWLDGYRAKDVEALVSLSIGDEIVLVGTGADEVRFGLAAFREQAARDFSQADELAMSLDNVRVDRFGDAAFAYGDVAVSGTVGGAPFEMAGLRCTFGLVRTADGWRFVQSHLSAPAGGQAPGSSF